MDEKKTVIETMLYRRERLDAKYEQIKDLLAGSDASFADLIRTPSGRYSQPKINRLVNDLLECLKEYRSYREAQKRSFGAKMELVTLKKEERDFYEAFFRVLIGLALYNNDGPGGKLKEPGTWSAIRERLGIPPCGDKAELYRDLICFENIWFLDGYPSRDIYGFYYDLLYLYEHLTDDYLSDLIVGADRKKAFSLMTKEEADLLKKEEKKPGTIAALRQQKEEEWQIAQQEYWEEHDRQIASGEIPPDDFEPEEFEMDEFEEEYYVDNIPYYDEKENIQEWKKYFSDMERFRNDCRLILENIVEMCEEHHFREEAANAVDLYLSENGVTGWLKEDDYFSVYAYLNKTLKASKKKMGID